jgi:glycosyltransferase involved in cell wall biosynthesis
MDMYNQINDPLVEVVIPVYNEESMLPVCIERLHPYLSAALPYRWRIVIADNASIDSTEQIGGDLAAKYTNVRYLRIPRKGRGFALKEAWSTSDADVLAYMDVDLSTRLDAFPALVAPLITGHSAVAIGSRLLPASHITRQLKREVLSRGYNALIRVGFLAPFHDAQCGFKAVRADAARDLIPEIEDNGWFFDTELLLLACHRGMRVVEIPVDWDEDLDSRVHLRSTVTDDLKGLWRMRKAFWSSSRVTRWLPLPGTKPISS